MNPQIMKYKYTKTVKKKIEINKYNQILINKFKMNLNNKKYFLMELKLIIGVH